MAGMTHSFPQIFHENAKWQVPFGSIKPRPLDAAGPESGPVHESHILSDQGVHLGAMAP
jgi:hypothetical protein